MPRFRHKENGVIVNIPPEMSNQMKASEWELLTGVEPVKPAKTPLAPAPSPIKGETKPSKSTKQAGKKNSGFASDRKALANITDSDEEQ